MLGVTYSGSNLRRAGTERQHPQRKVCRSHVLHLRKGMSRGIPIPWTKTIVSSAMTPLLVLALTRRCRLAPYPMETPSALSR